MTLQAIRAAVEQPLITAAAALTPAVPLFVDNQGYTEADAAKEHILVRIDFGSMSEASLQVNYEHIRGSVVVEVYTPKNHGPARNQEIATELMRSLNDINTCGPHAPTGAVVRVNPIDGPSFFALDQTPHFFGRLSCGFQARYT